MCTNARFRFKIVLRMWVILRNKVFFPFTKDIVWISGFETIPSGTERLP